VAALLGLRRGRRPGVSGVLFDAAADPMPPERDPRDAWDLVMAGRAAEVPELARMLAPSDPEALAAHWAAAASRLDPGRLWADHRRLRVRVDVLGLPSYPAALARDAAAPYALFRVGSSPDLAGPRVAIVGTRRASAAGREIAAEFGEALAAAGAGVVSGLALGIDGAAHQGALAARAAPPVGVVAGGFDHPYPARHRILWQQVAGAGVLVSEWPLGTRSEGWRFPARNRIIAALADAVVVVESREAGGSMVTAEEALTRDVPVLAVPGSIRNPAAAGTNKLIRDGAEPVCSVDDLLARLALESATSAVADRRPAPGPAGALVLEAVGWEPTSMATVASRCGLGPGALSLELAHLEMAGWVIGGAGWWERAGRPPPAAR
jgi:DNA processing protein